MIAFAPLSAELAPRAIDALLHGTDVAAALLGLAALLVAPQTSPPIAVTEADMGEALLLAHGGM